MTEFARLDIRVDSSSAKSATKELDKLGQQAKTTERAFADLVKTAAAGVLGAVGVAAIAREADAYANLSARIKLVTTSEEQFNAVRRQVIAISMRTGGELSATTDLYTKMARSVKGANATQANFLSVTETINKSLAVSGTTGQAAEGVIRQLGQGLAAGALRGDEFNSVMEGAPILMEAVAKSMGTTTGALRALAADGKLTSDVLVKALLKAGKDIDSQFAQMPLTISRASAELKTAFTVYIGTADQAAGASRATANAISLVANNFDAIANAILAVAVVAGGRYVVGMVAATRATVAAAVAARGLGGAITAAFGGVPGLVLTVAGLALSFVDFGSDVEEAKPPVDDMANSLAGMDQLAQQLAGNLDKAKEAFKRFTTADFRFEIELQRKALAALRKTLADVESRPDSVSSRNLAARLKAQIDSKQQEIDALRAGKRESVSADKKPRESIEGIARENALAAAERSGSVSAQVAAKSAIIRASYADELEQAKGHADRIKVIETRISEEIYDYKKSLTDRSKKEKADAAKQARDKELSDEAALNDLVWGMAEDQEQKNRELEDIRTQVAIDGARARGDVLTAEQMEIERRFAALIDKVLANGGTDADVSALESVMGFEKAKSQLEQFERDLARVKAEAAAGKENLKIGRESGNIGQGEFKQGVADIDAGMTAEIDGMIAKAKELGIVLPKAFTDATKAAEQTDQVMKLTGVSAADLAMNFSAGLSNAIMDVANGTKSAGEAFREFAAQFLAQIAQMIIQQMIFNALKVSFGFSEGGLVAGFASGGYTGDGGKYQPAGVVHRGEYVIPKHIVQQPGSLEFLRQYHAVGIKALPKHPGYADGGLVSNPGPMAANAVDNAAMMSSTLNNSQNFYLVDDPGRIADVLSSQKGRDAMVVAISREPGKFKSILKF